MSAAGGRTSPLRPPKSWGTAFLVAILMAGALPLVAAGRAPHRTAAASATETWATYANEKFGTVVSYPASRFAPEPPPDAHDGRSFTARDGARLAVFAHFNVLNDTTASLEASLTGEDYAAITYRARGALWLVVSGYRRIDGRPSVFYEKRILSTDGGLVHGFLISYPLALKAIYDPIAIRAAKSFGPGR